MKHAQHISSAKRKPEELPPLYEAEEVTSSPDMLEVATDYYAKLHRRRTTDTEAQDRLLRDGQEMPQGEAGKMDGMIDTKETATALRLMDNGKTPGLDGLPAELYKMYWKVIGSDLVDAYNHMVSVRPHQGSTRHQQRRLNSPSTSPTRRTQSGSTKIGSILAEDGGGHE